MRPGMAEHASSLGANQLGLLSKRSLWSRHRSVPGPIPKFTQGGDRRRVPPASPGVWTNTSPHRLAKCARTRPTAPTRPASGEESLGPHLTFRPTPPRRSHQARPSPPAPSPPTTWPCDPGGEGQAVPLGCGTGRYRIGSAPGVSQPTLGGLWVTAGRLHFRSGRWQNRQPPPLGRISGPLKYYGDISMFGTF